MYNEYFFRDLSNYMLCWTLVADGKAVRGGAVDNLQVEPKQAVWLTLPYYLSKVDISHAEVMPGIGYRLKTAEPLLEQGHTAWHTATSGLRSCCVL